MLIAATYTDSLAGVKYINPKRCHACWKYGIHRPAVDAKEELCGWHLSADPLGCETAARAETLMGPSRKLSPERFKQVFGTKKEGGYATAVVRGGGGFAR